MKTHITFIVCYYSNILYENKFQPKPWVRIPQHVHDLLTDQRKRTILLLDEEAIESLYPDPEKDFKECAENIKSLLMDQFLHREDKALFVISTKKVIVRVHESIACEEVLPLHQFTSTSYNRFLMEGESYVITPAGQGLLFLEKLSIIPPQKLAAWQPRS